MAIEQWTAKQERILRITAEARVSAYSREIARLEREVQRYIRLYVEQKKEIEVLSGALFLKNGSTAGASG